MKKKKSMEEEDVIYGHYNRVNNYASQNAIQSTIGAYSNIYSKDEIISFISKDFDRSLERFPRLNMKCGKKQQK